MNEMLVTGFNQKQVDNDITMHSDPDLRETTSVTEEFDDKAIAPPKNTLNQLKA